MTDNLARQDDRIARPLKVLVPLIVDELQRGRAAGLEHYRRAGDMLLEARDQVAEYRWGEWLTKNFALSRRTAYDYMRLAGRIRDDPTLVQRAAQPSIRSIAHPERARESRAEEMQLTRRLALQLVDMGFKALVMTVHPDKGGSTEAMARLNHVRDLLKRTVERLR